MSGLGFIQVEKNQQCDFCGKIAELRPYGPKGEAICFACAMENPQQTEKMMGQHLFGDAP